jgi:hypothetical protein
VIPRWRGPSPIVPAYFVKYVRHSGEICAIMTAQLAVFAQRRFELRRLTGYKRRRSVRGECFEQVTSCAVVNMKELGGRRRGGRPWLIWNKINSRSSAGARSLAGGCALAPDAPERRNIQPIPHQKPRVCRRAQHFSVVVIQIGAQPVLKRNFRCRTNIRRGAENSRRRKKSRNSWKLQCLGSPIRRSHMLAAC